MWKTPNLTYQSIQGRLRADPIQRRGPQLRAGSGGTARGPQGLPHCSRSASCTAGPRQDLVELDVHLEQALGGDSLVGGRRYELRASAKPAAGPQGRRARPIFARTSASLARSSGSPWMLARPLVPEEAQRCFTLANSAVTYSAAVSLKRGRPTPASLARGLPTAAATPSLSLLAPASLRTARARYGPRSRL